MDQERRRRKEERDGGEALAEEVEGLPRAVIVGGEVCRVGGVGEVGEVQKRVAVQQA